MSFMREYGDVVREHTGWFMQVGPPPRHPLSGSAR